MLLNSLPKTSWGCIWNANWASCCPSWSRERWALYAVQMFMNGFQWLPTTKHFLIQNTSVYFLSEPVSTWQFFLQRNIKSCVLSSLNTCFLCPAAAASTEPPSDCVPGSGCPAVHTQPALKETGGLELVQWATGLKRREDMLLLLPNTMSLCILWIEAGSALHEALAAHSHQDWLKISVKLGQ